MKTLKNNSLLIAAAVLGPIFGSGVYSQAAVPASVAAYQAAVLAEPSLISYYEFDAANANDNKSANNGTLGGAANFSVGFGGDLDEALNLGGSAWVDFGAVPAFDFTGGKGTVELWLRAGWTGTPSENLAIVGNFGSVAPNFNYTITMLPDKSRIILWDNNNWQSFPLPANAGTSWHHLAVVYNSTTWTLVWDGVSLGSGPITWNGLSGNQTQLGSTLPAGADWGGANWIGELDEVAFYSTNLPVSSVQSHYLIGTPPAIIAQPTGSNNWYVGQTRELNITVNPIQLPQYQWYTNGVLLSGATNSVLSVSNLVSGNAGTYTCVVSNYAGSVTSSPAVVVVWPFTAVAAYQSAVQAEPSLISYYSFDSLTANDDFRANNGTLVGTAGFAGGVGGASPAAALSLDGSGCDSLGAVSAFDFLNTNATVEMWLQAGDFSAFSGIGGSAACIFANWDPIAHPAFPNYAILMSADKTQIILWNPAGAQWLPYTLPAAAGTGWHHMAVEFNPGNWTLIWDGQLVNNSLAPNWVLTNGVTRLGAVHPTAFPYGAFYPWAGKMDEVAFYSNALPLNSIQTHYATYNVGGSAPVIITQPSGSNNWYVGQTRELNIAVNPVQQPHYQWYTNSVLVPGATNSILSVTNLASGNAGTYKCVVTNYVGSVTSSPAVVVVWPAPPVAAYQTAVRATPGLISYYSFDSLTANDDFGANNGALEGTASFGNGRCVVPDNALSLDGLSRANLGAVPAFNFLNGQGTVELWLQCGWTADLGGSAITPTIFANNSSVWASENYVVMMYGDRSAIAFWNGLTWNAITLPANASTNWHHMAVAFNTTTWTLFWDGVSVWTNSTSGWPGVSGTPTILGSSLPSGNPTSFTNWIGKLDEVAFYSNALPVSTIQAHYAAYVKPTPRALTLSGNRTYDGTTTLAAAGLTMLNNIDGANLTLSGTATLAGKDVGAEALVTAPVSAVRVQSKTGNTGSGASTTISVTGMTATTAGNTLVAVISTRGTAVNQVSTISGGGTWTRAAQSANANGTTTEIWYAMNITAGVTSVSITQASLRSAAVVMEYSGVLTASPLDAVNAASSTGSSTAPVTGTTPTTAQANELWVGGIGFISSTPTLGTIQNSFTSVASAQSTSGTASSNAKVYALERTVTGIAQASSGGTLSPSAQWSGAIATFKTTASVSGLTLGGPSAGNYTLLGSSGSVTVTPKALTVTGVTAGSTTYDGTTTAKLSGAAAFTTAEAAGAGSTSDGIPYNVDSVTAGGTAAGTLASKDVGTRAVTITGVTVTGTGSGNYMVTQPTGLTQAVTKKALTVSGITAGSTTYDGTRRAKLGGAAAFQAPEPPGAGSTSDGIPYIGDTVYPGGPAPSGTLAAKDVGTEAVTITGVLALGSNSGNYTVTQQTGLTQNVTPKALTVSGITAGSTVYDGTTTAKLGGSATFLGTEAAGAGTTADGKPYSVDSVSPGTVTGTLAAKGVGAQSVTTSVAVSGTGNGNYTVTLQAGLTQNVTPKPLATGITADAKVYDAATMATVSGAAALLTAENPGTGSTSDGTPYNGDAVDLTGTATNGTFNTKDVGTSRVVIINGLSLTNSQAGNYSVATVSADITPKALTMSGLSVPGSKVYDGTTAAVVSGTSVLQTAEPPGDGSTSDGLPYTGDTVNFTGTATGTYDSKNVGAATTVTYGGLGLDNGNYSLTIQSPATATITAKALTVSGITASGTTYDGTTTAKLGGAAVFPAPEPAGAGSTDDGIPYDVDLVSPGVATGTLAAKDVGTQNVTVTSVMVTGTGSGNYTVMPPTGLTQNVTQKALTVSGIIAGSTTYDGTTTAKLGGTAAFPAPEPAGAGSTSDGMPYEVDSVTPGGTAAGTLAVKDVGAEAVTITGVTVTGTGAGNYAVTQQMGLMQNVTPKPLTVSGITADSTVYDGTTTAKLGGAAVFQMAEPAGAGSTSDGIPYDVDAVTAGGTAAGVLATKDVGTNSVTITGVTVTGTGNGNYAVTQQADLTQIVTPKPLATGLTADAKVYDATTLATVSGTAALLTPEVAGTGSTSDGKPYNGDVVDLTGTATDGTFDTKDVGTGKVVTINGLSLANSQADNYSVATVMADITAKALTMSGLSVPGNKVYDGTTAVVVSGTPALQTAEDPGSGSTIDGMPYAGDTVNISGTVTGTYNDKDVATATTVAYSGLGLDNGNYSLTIQSPAAATITAKALTVSGITAGSTTYDGTMTAKLGGLAVFSTPEPVGSGSTDDGIPYDVDSVSPGTATGTLAAKDVGPQTVIVNSVTVTGTGNGNYTVTLPTGLTQNVTPKAITVAGLTASARAYDGTTNAPLGGLTAFAVPEGAGTGSTGDGIPYDVDSVSPGGTPSGAFANANVGTAKPVTVIGVTVTGLGNGNYSVTQQTGLTADITQASPVLLLSASNQTNGYMDSVSFTATLPADATGEVVFSSADGSFGTNTVSGITTSSLTITNLPRGTNLITAIYSGDGNYLGSTNMLDQVVTNHPPVVTGNSYSRNGMTSWSISVSDLLTNATDVDGDTLTVDNAGTSTNLASLVIASGYVTYTNPNLVDDQFTVTVTDGFGGTNSALITLLSGVVGTNSIASLVSGNPTTLTAYGVPDYSYITERSTNLFDWVNIVTNAAATNGMITVRDYFGDLGSNAPTKAYYRLKWQRE